MIETIVVLVILGLALGIVASFVPRRNTTVELAYVTSRVASALRLTQSRAEVSGRQVAFIVTPDGHGYMVDRVLAPLGPAVAIAVSGPGQPAILFAPDGSGSGGTLRVTVAGRSRLVHVDWLTGRVAVTAGS